MGNSCNCEKINFAFFARNNQELIYGGKFIVTDPNQIEQKIFSLLLMRYKLTPSVSLAITREWLSQHPQETPDDLYAYLRHELVKIDKGKIVDLYPSEVCKLVKEMRGENGLEIKERNYRFKTYPRCFTAQDAVKWLIETQKVTKPEALKLGQNLVDLKLIHHVTDDHDFKDDYLFFRFYIDE
jgi:hypothetical protein